MNEDLESLITTDMQRIYEMLEDGPTGWGWYSFNARSVMETIDKLPLFFSDRSTIERQFWVLAGLQKLASLAPNPRNTRDIARWCKRQWPAVLGHQPDHVGCLEGGPFPPYIPSHRVVEFIDEKLTLERIWTCLDAGRAVVYRNH